MRHKALTCAAVLMTAACAPIEKDWAYQTMRYMPPAEYRVEPSMEVVEIKADVGTIPYICRTIALLYSPTMRGCMKFDQEGRCVIVIPTIASTHPVFQELVRIHEKAHCVYVNGVRWKHPNDGMVDLSTP